MMMVAVIWRGGGGGNVCGSNRTSGEHVGCCMLAVFLFSRRKGYTYKRPLSLLRLSSCSTVLVISKMRTTF